MRMKASKARERAREFARVLADEPDPKPHKVKLSNVQHFEDGYKSTDSRLTLTYVEGRDHHRASITHLMTYRAVVKMLATKMRIKARRLHRTMHRDVDIDSLSNENRQLYFDILEAFA